MYLYSSCMQIVELMNTQIIMGGKYRDLYSATEMTVVDEGWQGNSQKPTQVANLTPCQHM